MTRYLVTGAAGMLGTDMLGALRRDDPRATITALDRSSLDITDEAAVMDAVAGHDVVINTAAWTRVDDAEESEADAALVNATAAGYLAQACSAAGATLVQFSTDYVFDGTATEPYPEDAPVHPASAYGRTKAEGERRAITMNPGRTHVVRTSWLYGEHGPSFPRTMLRLAGEREHVDVVDDQHGGPTWTVDLARAVVELLQSGAPARIWHWSNSGRTTWYGLAREVFELAGLDPDRVRPTSSAQFVRPAPRPSFSVLGHDAWLTAGLPRPRSWKDALREAMSTGALGS
jgi:dTDP-4-dehydrorhamnose reductase